VSITSTAHAACYKTRLKIFRPYVSRRRVSICYAFIHRPAVKVLPVIRRNIVDGERSLSQDHNRSTSRTRSVEPSLELHGIDYWCCYQSTLQMLGSTAALIYSGRIQPSTSWDTKKVWHISVPRVPTNQAWASDSSAIIQLVHRSSS
jgi:hypothetical protein